MSLLEKIINGAKIMLAAATINAGVASTPVKADEVPIVPPIGAASDDYVPPANDAELDARLLETHTPLWTMTNPIPEKKMVGIAGNGKGEFAIAWAHGDVGRYSESTTTAPTSPIAYFGGGDSTTNSVFYNINGPASITGEIGVGVSGGTIMHMLSGTETPGFSIYTPYTLRDIKTGFGKVWVATNKNGGTLNEDGTINQMFSAGEYTFLPIDLKEGLTDRVLIGGGILLKLNPDLTFNPDYAITTDYISNEGIALTENTLLTIRGSTVFCYANPFKDIMQTETELVGDFNHDGAVDTLDLNIMVSEWLQVLPAPVADLDKNGFVDYKDFSIFADNWLL